MELASDLGIRASLSDGQGHLTLACGQRRQAWPRLLYVADPLLGFIPGIGAAVQRFGLGGLSSGATGTAGFPASAHLLGQGAATLTLGGYALAILLAGALLLKRRDITT